ncbi:MAG: DNA replication and repair protein RecF [Pseudomonadales bacterium]|nr:DNA replication and repair protein RecF [Pseudomonadales bacterium]
MHLQRLHIDGLRNISAADLELGAGFNYLYGDNGAGKTAILEAVHVLARGRSFRSNSLERLVNKEPGSLLVRAEVSNRSGTHRLGFARTDAKNQYRIDGQHADGFARLAGQIAVQTLLPDASDLVYGSPGERRRFLDWGLFHVKHDHLSLARQYNRALMQRNAWLKSQESSGATWQEDPWVESVVDHGLQLNKHRSEYVQRLQQPFRESLSALSVGIDLALAYGWGGLQDEAESRKKMSESFARDVKFGATQRGPHRADLLVTAQGAGSPNGVDPSDGSSQTAKIGGAKASEILSRGQAKIAASALVLAQVELQRQEIGENSIVLIDDFGAELDAEHWRRFLSTLERLDCQVIATSTEAPGNLGWLEQIKCDVFHVEQGKVGAESSS